LLLWVQEDQALLILSVRVQGDQALLFYPWGGLEKVPAYWIA